MKKSLFVAAIAAISLVACKKTEATTDSTAVTTDSAAAPAVDSAAAPATDSAAAPATEAAAPAAEAPKTEEAAK